MAGGNVHVREYATGGEDRVEMVELSRADAPGTKIELTRDQFEALKERVGVSDHDALWAAIEEQSQANKAEWMSERGPGSKVDQDREANPTTNLDGGDKGQDPSRT